MTEKKLSDDQLARELIQVQKDRAGSKEPIAIHHSNDGSAIDAVNRIDSAKKIMALIHKARPSATKTINGTVSDTTASSLSSQAPTRELSQDFSVSPEQIPSTIGRFEIRSLIGKGGFGIVFRAYDPKLDRIVALKVPTFNSLLNEDSQIRFHRESRVVASLSHPNIVPVYEVGSDGPISFIVSEYIAGTNLSEWIKSHGPLEPKVAANVVSVISEAVQHAHLRNVVHRDLKPANILLKLDPTTPDFDPSQVRVADFGLARFLAESEQENTHTGSVIGTPAFAAPEQLLPTSSRTSANKRADGRESSESTTNESKTHVDTSGSNLGQADVYSLGAILYFLLTGNAPFEGDSIAEMIRLAQTVEPDSPRKIAPSVPIDLAAIALKCLEKSPSQRYQNPNVLVNDLQRFINGETVQARQPGWPTKLARWVKRNPLATALLVSVIASSVVVSMLLWRSENLRVLSDAKSDKIARQTKQLQRAIDKLFVTVADTPQLKESAFDDFRKRILGDANGFAEEFLSETPDDPELFELHINTQLSLMQLNHALGNTIRAHEISHEIVESIDKQSQRFAKGSDHRSNLVNAKVKALLTVLSMHDSLENHRKREALIMSLVDGEMQLNDSLESNQLRAVATAEIAQRKIWTQDFTAANRMSMKALQLWESIPIEKLNSPSVVRDFARSYAKCLATLAGSEDKRAPAVGKRAIEILEPKVDSLSWAGKSNLANIYRMYAYSIHSNQMELAIATGSKGCELAKKVAASNSSIPMYQLRNVECGCSQAILHFLKRDFDTAERLLNENLREIGELENEFSQQLNIAQIKSNTLTYLAIIYGTRQQWDKKLEILDRVRLQTAQLAHGRTRVSSTFHQVQLCDLKVKMAVCYLRLNDLDKALGFLKPSIDSLEELAESDSKNRSLVISLVDCLRRLIEAQVRSKSFSAVDRSIERLRELGNGKLGGVELVIQLEVMVGRQDFAEALNFIGQHDDAIVNSGGQSKYIAWSLARVVDQIDDIGSNAENDDAPEATATKLHELRNATSELASKVLQKLIAKSDDRESRIKMLQKDPELDPFRGLSCFNDSSDDQ